MTARHHAISSVQLKHTIACYIDISLMKLLKPLKFVSREISLWK